MRNRDNEMLKFPCHTKLQLFVRYSAAFGLFVLCGLAYQRASLLGVLPPGASRTSEFELNNLKPVAGALASGTFMDFRWIKSIPLDPCDGVLPMATLSAKLAALGAYRRLFSSQQPSFECSATSQVKRITQLYNNKLRWNEAFKMTSAWHIEFELSSVHMARTVHSKAIKFVVLGDVKGHLYFVSSHGGTLWEQDTGCDCALTSIASYELVSGRECVLWVATSEGTVMMYNIAHKAVNVHGGGGRSYVINSVTLASSWSYYQQHPASQTSSDGGQQLLLSVASKSGANRYLNAVLRSEKEDLIVTWHENGTVRNWSPSPSRVLHLHSPGAQAAALTQHETLLFTPRHNPSLRSFPCANLNSSSFSSVCVNPAQRNQGYAVDDAGQVLVLAFKNERTLQDCKVKYVHRLHITSPSLLSCNSGYLLLSTSAGMSVFNISDAHARKTLPQVVEAQASDALTTILPKLPDSSYSVQAMQSDEKLLAVQFGGGVFALYHCLLAFPLDAFQQPKPWLGRPLILFSVVIAAVWMYNAYSKGNSGAHGLPPELLARRERMLQGDYSSYPARLRR